MQPQIRFPPVTKTEKKKMNKRCHSEKWVHQQNQKWEPQQHNHIKHQTPNLPATTNAQYQQQPQAPETTTPALYDTLQDWRPISVSRWKKWNVHFYFFEYLDMKIGRTCVGYANLFVKVHFQRILGENLENFKDWKKNIFTIFLSNWNTDNLIIIH